jgi:hypothetical protein
MRIVMPDGRVIEGTPLQIVDFMRSLALAPEGTSIADYVRTTVARARTLLGVELEVEDGSDEEMAGALVGQLVSKGLARRGSGRLTTGADGRWRCRPTRLSWQLVAAGKPAGRVGVRAYDSGVCE